MGAVDHGRAAIRRDAAGLAVQVRAHSRHFQRGRLRQWCCRDPDSYPGRDGLWLRAGRTGGRVPGPRVPSYWSTPFVRLRPQNAAARRSAWQTAACRCHKARGSLQRGSSSRLYSSRCHRGQRRPSSRWGCCADRELAAAVRACQHRNLTPAGDAWPASYRRAGGSSPFETAHGFLLCWRAGGGGGLGVIPIRDGAWLPPTGDERA